MRLETGSKCTAMRRVVEEAVGRIIGFLSCTDSDLPIADRSFREFLVHSIVYILQHEAYSDGGRRQDFLSDFLFPLEIAAGGRFQFALDHAPWTESGQSHSPTIQVTSTSPGFHGLVLQRSDRPLASCCDHHAMETPFGTLQIGHIRNRVVDRVDLEHSHPELYTFKQWCLEHKVPIIYLLGSARQFPSSNGEHAKAVGWQKSALDRIFAVAEARYGDRIVFGTGGWAGRIEGSLGVPRLGYLAAIERGKKVLTTIPRCGSYDKHERSTLEAVCGEHWGDDSPVLATMCDGAFIFGTYGTWTKIEMQNLLKREKPFVVINAPDEAEPSSQRMRDRVTSGQGDYQVFGHADVAAHTLFDSIDLASCPA